MTRNIEQPISASLASLIGSRICHDLINPIGAISNGLELVAMNEPTPEGPEMSLIQQSCDNATARIQFFRIAFGSAGDHQLIPQQTAARVLANQFAGTRISTAWRVQDDVARCTVQLGYLAALCLETALPYGGEVAISQHNGSLICLGSGDSVTQDPALWSHLQQDADGEAGALRPAQVQFALLAQICSEFGNSLEVVEDEAGLRLIIQVPSHAS